jgi:hypothetical protein
MAQLNIHIPETSDLLNRVEQHARALGLSAGALARAVLDVALEPYVQAQLEARDRERERRTQVVDGLRERFSGALPARPVPDEDATDEPVQSPLAAGQR